MQPENMRKPNSWVLLIGFILLLIGIYGVVRTTVNLTTFEKYPSGGIYSFQFFSSIPYYPLPREQDCTYPHTYYEDDGMTLRQPNEQEKQLDEQTMNNCLEGMREVRETAKVNDISMSLLFLFLGGGVLIARRFFV